jgi:hypothetical protein
MAGFGIKHHGNFKDLTHQIFGRLTVLETVGRQGSNYLWRCQCECGANVIILGCRLSMGRTRSCGCIKTKKPEQFIEDFWSRVNIKESDECWPWMAGASGSNPSYNYGSFWAFERRWCAHQFAAFIVYGNVDKHVCHHCDNPSCVNPTHLFLGTQAENNADCNAKGRRNQEYGEARYNAKLTEENVREIKTAALTRKRGFIISTAKRFGVSKAAIKNILCGLRWKHVQI